MIQNRETLTESKAHEQVLDCIEAAIDAAAPEVATQSTVSMSGEELTIGERVYNLKKFENILIVGGGKASGGVIVALESILGERISGGMIVTQTGTETKSVDCLIGDHPFPSQRNVEATEEILELLDSVGSETLVLVVVTGGSSALLSSPARDLSIDDLHTTTEALLKRGVPIQEINTVRKHLSRVKGGQLMQRAAPATVVTLIVSDVTGNDLSTIGSGPTVPDETTFSDALAVFDRYEINPPQSVSDHLKSGEMGRILETPFENNAVFDHSVEHLISDNLTALEAAQRVAREQGYEAIVLSSRLGGEACETADTILSVADECLASGNPVEPPVAILVGGEWTVTVSADPGTGGPNQELVLSAAQEIEQNTVIASVDTDGKDGASEVAGAIVDAETVIDVTRAAESLSKNDAGSYLSEVGATIQTGPTGTNVNDIVVVLIGSRR